MFNQQRVLGAGILRLIPHKNYLKGVDWTLDSDVIMSGYV